MGRPKKSESERRSVKLSVSLTPEEAEEVSQWSESQGQSFSGFFRLLLDLWRKYPASWERKDA